MWYNITMRKWCIENETEIKLVENLVTRGDDEIKVKMSKVALSADDIVHFLQDEEHIVPGHSGVAYVSEADESLGFKLGSRVIVSPFIKTEKHGVERVTSLESTRMDFCLTLFLSPPKTSMQFPMVSAMMRQFSPTMWHLEAVSLKAWTAKRVIISSSQAHQQLDSFLHRLQSTTNWCPFWLISTEIG